MTIVLVMRSATMQRLPNILNQIERTEQNEQRDKNR